MAKKAAKGAAAKKKRTVSGKRGKPGRKTSQGADPRGIAGIAIFCVGLLALLCQFIPSNGGFLNRCMLIVRGLGGMLCLLLPVVLCWTGAVLVFFNEKKLSAKTLIFGSLIFLFVEAMFQLFRISGVNAALAADGAEANYGAFLVRSFTMSSLDCKGGGFIGALLAWPLYKAMDVWGGMIVLIFATAIVLMAMTGFSFGGMGMRISEWIDDFRVERQERREEQEALRDARQEEELEHENALAIERQKRRQERLQKQKEEQEAAAREAAAREKERQRDEEIRKALEPKDEPEEAAPQLPRRKEKPKLTVMRTQETDRTDDQPVITSRPPRKAAAPRKRRTISDGAQLYIERDDEFTRAPVDEHVPTTPSRRNSFTMQEAENAFLYGMNGGQGYTANDAYSRPTAGYGPNDADQQAADDTPRDAYGQPTAGYGPNDADQQAADDTPRDAYGQPTAGYGPNDADQPAAEYADGEYSPAEPEPIVEPEMPVNAYAQEDEEEDDEAASITNARAEGADRPIDDSYFPDASEDEEAGEPQTANIEYDDGDAQVTADESHDEPEDEPASVMGGSFGGWPGQNAQTMGNAPSSYSASAIDAARARAERNAGYRPPQSVAPQGNPNGQRNAPQSAGDRRSVQQPPIQPQGQDVLQAQRMNEQQTVVQLRGNRIDGTPIVMPAKDVHEAPQTAKEEYVFPPIDLLNQGNTTQDPNQRAKDEAGARKLLGTLESFGVQAKLLDVTHGPAITRYELAPAPGVKVSRIVGLVDDIALNMASDGVRIEAPIPGKPAVGIEIPNQKIETVSLRDVLESPEMMREKSPTAVALGKGISGAPVIADMAKMPHVLIAGATGSGKSVCINTIINSIIFRAKPEEVRLILIDPKVVELSVYNGIPHLLVPVVTDPKKASAALSWAVVEMEHRYKRFETMGVRDIRGYNNAIGPNEEPMSKIIVIIDELADLMMVAPGEVEESICRLAQLARAAGIHLVIATQRPSVNVITGVIKANIPSRIAFAVSSQIDSRTILDSGGAEKLLGKGDMLYAPQGAGKPTRVQGCFVSDDEVQRIVEFVRGRHSADYNEDVIEQMNTAADEDSGASSDAPSAGEPVDEMLAKAIELAVDAGQVSISMLQRRLRVGYARAGRLVDEMTLRGITAEAEGPTKPRTVLISREEWRRMQENQE